ncbi:PREDICTED: DNA annealing helicase and endonuclease ZRANB3 isoform X3 [Ipomoea nil]|uniref:DNA annealing helicase and endonuclease ZRANB3 isoform X3 n=1 Tax=Ipomoea nil TaxID=35883 RepID=UPI00090093A1|nr:PREDICTED: DNA annealing helicase and endonuclease ZRANB3 isoform X3 [Ipomoea nil]
MEITEEQRKRAEANRLAALAKRKANQEAWKLLKCQKPSSESSPATATATAVLPKTNPASASDLLRKPESSAPPLERFRVMLEICSPDSFSVTPQPVQGFPYPGEEVCFQKLNELLFCVVPSHYTQNTGGGRGCVYKLPDYEAVLRSIKSCKDIECEEIPWGTLNVVERLSHSFNAGRWIPCRPEHLPDEKVDELISELPKTLLDTLLPFQLEGIRFGLRRGGRCLIADEMGLGKTLQAIAIARCFMNEGPTLIVCPAILRYSWAEELEHWLSCLPSDIHLVFGHQDNPSHLSRCPRFVVISYTMLKRLRRSILKHEWAILIIDESHHLRCSKKKSEPEEIKAVLDVAVNIKHLILLSGTPSLSRPYDIFHQINMLWPGLLGKTKYEFAKTYCSIKLVKGCQGKDFYDFSKGIRLEELHMLLKQTVMIRRLKVHVLVQLPPKRRQIIRLVLKKSDIANAMASTRVSSGNAPSLDASGTDAESTAVDIPDKTAGNSGNQECTAKLSEQELGIAKLSGFCEWLSIHPVIAEIGDEEPIGANCSSQKMIIFAHHHKVLDGVQEFVYDKGINYVRIDGNTPAFERQSAILSFQNSKEVKIAIVGILAGGSGLNLSAAQNVVFLELPKEPAHMQQDTADEICWQSLNRSLHRVSSTMNGKYDAVQEIEVDDVSYLGTAGKIKEKRKNFIPNEEKNEVCLLQPTKIQNPCCNESDKMVTESNQEHNESAVYISSSQSNDLEQAVTKSKIDTLECTSDESDSEDSDHNQEEKLNVALMESKVHDCGSVKQIESNNGSSIHLKSLRFEVSPYTGRIHLYSCIPGKDTRPRPLFENFRQEELDLLHASVDDKEKAYKCIKDDPAFSHVLQSFVNEWNSLRPIKQKKLMGKPLQLPLSTELCYLNENINYDNEGLLKGRSKKRTTPLDEISHPLPSNATWKTVRLVGSNKKERVYTQGWSDKDEPLCKLCQSVCKKSNAKEPEYFEDLFCSLDCHEEYRLRTSRRYIRERLSEIEHGICTGCKLNCHKLVKHIRPLLHDKREEHIKKVAPQIAKRKKLLKRLVDEPNEGNAWHADHIIPVYKGGGECLLENMRTLCVACHADVTAAQHNERRKERQKAKKHLRMIMRDLKTVVMPDQVENKTEDSRLSIDSEDVEDDHLLINIPGSAYSGSSSSTTGNQGKASDS